METPNRRSSRSNFGAILVCFGLTSAIAIVLLVTALVVWMSYMTGSLIASALIVGGFFALLSYVIYLLAIRDALERFNTQIATIYEVARVVQTGYEWVTEKILLFMNLREELRDKK